MPEYSCHPDGHLSWAEKPLARCPHYVRGRPCAGTLQPTAGSGRQAPELEPEQAEILEAVKRGDPLEVLHTGRWYAVDHARPLRSRVEVRFTTGTGPRLKSVTAAYLRPA